MAVHKDSNEWKAMSNELLIAHCFFIGRLPPLGDMGVPAVLFNAHWFFDETNDEVT